MAACTHEIGTADTGNTPNTSGAFTPALGDLLVVFCIGSADASPFTATLSCTTGQTFTQFLHALFAAGVNSIYGFVSDTLVSSAVSQTVTFTPTDTCSGSIIFVCAVAGMTRTGLSAIRQSAKQEDQGAGTPAPAFGVAALTDNPVLGCIGNSTNPAGLTPPGSWTEPATGDLGYATPTTGGEYVFRDSGFTGTTVTWGGASASAFGSMIVELDTSVLSLAVKDILGRGMLPVRR